MIDRDAISLKIPAYLRGELTPEDMAEINALAAKDAEIAADIEFQKALGLSLKEVESRDSHAELAWARLSNSIDKQDSSLEVSNDNVPSKLWKYAAAVLTCIVIGQAALFNGGNDKTANDQYLMAGYDEAGISLTVTFNDAATTKELTEFLQIHDAIVSSNPNKIGHYHLVFSDIETCQTALGQIKKQADIFEAYTTCITG